MVINCKYQHLFDGKIEATVSISSSRRKALKIKDRFVFDSMKDATNWYKKMKEKYKGICASLEELKEFGEER